MPVKVAPNPNSPRFARGALIERFKKRWSGSPLHPLNRKALEPVIQSLQPLDWLHILGAIDVLMDNFGMLAAEQFDPAERRDYESELPALLYRYLLATRVIVPNRPWKGNYLLGSARSAQAGEPRPFLRLLASRDSRNLSEPSFFESGYAPSFRNNKDEQVFQIPWSDIWPTEFNDSPQGSRTVYPRGIILPEGFPEKLERTGIVSPTQATPDLPLRCGIEQSSLTIYKQCVFNQGTFGTCLASATAVALAIALHRAGKKQNIPKGGFSVSWLDCDTDELGTGWGSGRLPHSALPSLQRGLPCSAEAFPYFPSFDTNWKTPQRVSSALYLESIFGRPQLKPVNLANIGRLKLLLSAGWVIVFSIAWPKLWSGNSRFNEFGMPPAPLPGTHYDGGHAMVMVGYDHVDGNNQWKYQGRFYCLNSWGDNWPSRQAWGAGLCSLPFSLFLTQGLRGAFAIRF